MLNHIVMIPIKKYPLLFALIVLTLALASGCDRGVDMCTEAPQSIRIHFNISADPLLSTRSAGSVDNSVAESAVINDLNIYIWNNLFAYHKYYSSAAVANMEIVTGNYNVVAIANAGHDLGEVDAATLNTATLSELGIDATTNPILTFTDKINIASAVNINLSLKRTFSYVAFNFTVENSFTDCTLRSYRLYNVPASTTIAPPTAGTYTNVALCTATTAYYPLNGATSASDKTYIFENCRPDVSTITDPKERTRDKAPAGATYMELYCQHTDGRLFALRFYLGDGSPSSFSLRRNTRTQYNITIYSENDARVTSIEAAYSPITQQIIASGTSAGFYDLGTVSYTATDARDLTRRCIPTLGIGTLLASKGGALQVYKDGAWVNCNSEAPATIPPSNISGSTASMKYRAYIPAAFLNAASSIQQHMDARYLVAENQYQTLATVDASTRFGYKATLRSSSPKATFTLSAENAATAWTDTSDTDQNICIETAATNKNARYVVRGTAEFLKNFAGLYDDETGAAVGRITSTTANSITGTFPVTKTGSYTLRFTTATISVAETNKNQTYMLNKNTITVQDTESHPTLNVTLQCADGDGIFLRNATYDSTERAWNGTEESSKLVYTQATSLGSLSIPVVFVPLKSGLTAYTITVCDTSGAMLATKTVSNTIAKKNCTWNATLGIDPDGCIDSGWYDVNICLQISTTTPLDYLGKGFEATAPVTFDFESELNARSSGFYPTDSPYAPANYPHKITPLQTTLTLNIKNKDQKIRIYPILGGWGDRYANKGSWAMSYYYYEEGGQYETFDWTISVSDGINFYAKSIDIQLLENPQLNLTINKKIGRSISPSDPYNL